MPIFRRRGLPEAKRWLNQRGQPTFGLETQPEPGQVDGDAADVTVAGSTDAAFSGGIAALVWSRGQADERTDLPTIFESSPGELAGIGLGADRGNATQSHQASGNLCDTVLVLPNPSIPFALELQNVEQAERYAKFWLRPVSLARSRGFRTGEIAEIQRIVEEHRALFEERWHEHLER